MYLKVENGSRIYDELYRILTSEENRFSNYVKFVYKNLPPFGNKVVINHSPFEIYPTIRAWKLEGEVDPNIWQPYTPYPDFYVPNKRTKAGKTMHARLIEAMGEPYYRFCFFELFEIDIPFDLSKLIFPNGFMEDEACFMLFDDAFKSEIYDKMLGNFMEISEGEWEKAHKKYEMEQKIKIKEVIET